MAEALRLTDISAEQLRAYQDELRDRFYRSAFIKDAERRYISIPEINQHIDNRFMLLSTLLMVRQLVESGLNRADLMIALPQSGGYFANGVALLSGMNMEPARKGTDIPGSWINPLIIPDVESPTTRAKSSFAINTPVDGWRGKTVVLGDDFLSGATTSLAFTYALESQGAQVVGMAVHCDKLFAGGNTELEQRGIPTYSVFAIEGINGHAADLRRRILLSQRGIVKP